MNIQKGCMNMKKITALVLALMLLAVSSCALADHLDQTTLSFKNL